MGAYHRQSLRAAGSESRFPDACEQSIILVGQAFSVVPLDAPFYKAYHDTPAGERFSDLYNFLLDGLVPIIVRVFSSLATSLSWTHR